MGKHGLLYDAYYDCLSRLPVIDFQDGNGLTCNISQAFTVGGFGSVMLERLEPMISNTNGDLYSLSEPSLILKVVKVRQPFEAGLLCMEKSVTRLLNGLNNQVIRTYPITSGLDPMCEAASYVMDRGVGSVDRLAFSSEEIALVLGQALRILRNLHALGVYHRDPHFGNFVLLDRADVVGSLRLIDFGLARPIRDPDNIGFDFRMLANEAGRLFRGDELASGFSASVVNDTSITNIDRWIRALLPNPHV
jgi:serine/threonine protein kinase